MKSALNSESQLEPFGGFFAQNSAAIANGAAYTSPVMSTELGNAPASVADGGIERTGTAVGSKLMIGVCLSGGGGAHTIDIQAGNSSATLLALEPQIVVASGNSNIVRSMPFPFWKVIVTNTSGLSKTVAVAAKITAGGV